MVIRMKRQKGLPIEEFKCVKFTTSIRFDKNSGLFTAVVPSNTPLEDKTLAGIKVKLHEYEKSYELPGGWVKKIYIDFSHRGSDHSVGGGVYGSFLQFEERGLTLGWCTFEEREISPAGQRVCRSVPSPEMAAARKRANYSEDNGRDESWALDKARVLLWTPEREQVLVAIQKGLAQLAERLDTVLEQPELAAGALQKLLGGGP